MGYTLPNSHLSLFDAQPVTVQGSFTDTGTFRVAPDGLYFTGSRSSRYITWPNVASWKYRKNEVTFWLRSNHVSTFSAANIEGAVAGAHVQYALLDTGRDLENLDEEAHEWVRRQVNDYRFGGMLPWNR
jgi:hypothetical protein